MTDTFNEPEAVNRLLRLALAHEARAHKRELLDLAQIVMNNDLAARKLIDRLAQGVRKIAHHASIDCPGCQETTRIHSAVCVDARELLTAHDNDPVTASFNLEDTA